ncbi:peptidoglycan glycosyltransferase [Alkalibacter rhizosphaerae]|uniref:Peptidoglycan glycosyltransferase n=1 Tax=Alkalibacter rhizosphaerae TaxID=2815577 RepID=A0A975AIF4_9FIRM|nr:penicillin-binding transpeptidase domain-containing protein [Alkalibacter rhizosphaerae]QSX08619.1 peptidoglycan glycosyltransferase [Alkalibacter rhizosphaerae]
MNENKRVLKGFLFIGVLFVLLIGYLTYFELFLKEDIVQNTYNRRIWEVDTGRIRGSILDRNGETLAYSESTEDDTQVRFYPFEELYAHVIGYHTPIYGNAQLEAAYQDELSGNKALNRIMDLPKQLTGEKLFGNQLQLTLDHDLQKKAWDLLQGQKGAVVALDPKTGAVLAMVSNPSYDPNQDKLSGAWEDLQNSRDSVLLPRATQGLYPPGSTFKCLTTAAAAASGNLDLVWKDEGSILVDGMIIRNFNSQVFGRVDLDQAFTKSINTYFAALGLEMGEDAIQNTAAQFGFNQKIPFDLQVSPSRLDQGDMSQTELASTSIGQGTLLVTPLHMALMGAGIANEGSIMEPYLVERVTMDSGRVVEAHSRKIWMDGPTSDTAALVKELMVQVVESGTGTNARISGISVAGKTGTAQNERDGEDHAWFMGFAPAEDPRIVVAVLLEYSGSTGGNSAAPIAGKLMENYLN